MLRCPRGHAFDRSKQGYWNLLQPQDRRSTEAGDTRSAVEARTRWLARGLADGLARVVGEIANVEGVPSGGSVVDLGCGEGFFGRTLCAGRDVSYCGVDLSVHALRAATRAWPEATWVVANADRRLPLLAQSVDLLLSLFGRRPAEDVARVVRPGAAIVVAVPAADDLAELRQAVLGRAGSRDRAQSVIEALEPHVTTVERHVWRERACLDRAGIDDALALTYRGARHSQQARIADLLEIEVTLSAEIVKGIKS